MRSVSIKTEKEPFNWKAFFTLFFILLLFFNIIYFILDQFEVDKEPEVTWYFQRGLWAFFYPLLFSSVMTNNLTRAKLIISDFEGVQDFNAKLIQRIEKFKVKQESTSAAQTVYVPSGKFKSLFNYWYGTEKIALHMKEGEVLVTGPLNRISQLEDTLTWNKDFKK